MNKLTREEVELQLIERAMKDKAFRTLLLNSPHEALKTVFGVTLPDSIQCVVLEEDPNHFFLVLPAANREGAGNELSELELQQVSAGGLDRDLVDMIYSRMTCAPA